MHYAVLADEFVGMCVQPVWESLVRVAHLSGVVRMPSDLQPGSADDALYIGQSMPWINPVHEAEAWLKLISGNLASEVEVIRKRGNNPQDTIDQISFRKKVAEKGVAFASVPDAPTKPKGKDDPDETPGLVD